MQNNLSGNSGDKPPLWGSIGTTLDGLLSWLLDLAHIGMFQCPKLTDRLQYNAGMLPSEEDKTGRIGAAT